MQNLDFGLKLAAASAFSFFLCVTAIGFFSSRAFHWDGQGKVTEEITLVALARLLLGFFNAFFLTSGFTTFRGISSGRDVPVKNDHQQASARRTAGAHHLIRPPETLTNDLLAARCKECIKMTFGIIHWTQRSIRFASLQWLRSGPQSS